VKGLSCFTANLHAYLGMEWDADAILARSNQFAIRIDGSGRPNAFSHHRPALDLLPDGSRLRFRGADAWLDAVGEIDDEVARWGRAILMVDGTALPWSIPRPTDEMVPIGSWSTAWRAADGTCATGSRRCCRSGRSQPGRAGSIRPRWLPCSAGSAGRRRGP
jgi:hypothetical protein